MSAREAIPRDGVFVCMHGDGDAAHEVIITVDNTDPTRGWCHCGAVYSLPVGYTVRVLWEVLMQSVDREELTARVDAAIAKIREEGGW